MLMKIEPVTLTGKHVRLEPLSRDHHAGLTAVSLDESIWRWIPYQIKTPEDMRKYIDKVLEEQARGISLPFATCEAGSGRVIGCTRFMNIDVPNKHVEIGGTWIGVAWQRSAVNTEAKYLMMKHAFETWKCIRVELKTDSLNERSRAAILRIGAKQEGIFRNHMICHDGRIRHSVYFSVTREEWPDVEAGLKSKMNRK